MIQIRLKKQRQTSQQENREVVYKNLNLAAVFDLAGIRAPKRQCTRTEFPSIGTFIA